MGVSIMDKLTDVTGGTDVQTLYVRGIALGAAVAPEVPGEPRVHVFADRQAGDNFAEFFAFPAQLGMPVAVLGFDRDIVTGVPNTGYTLTGLKDAIRANVPDVDPDAWTWITHDTADDVELVDADMESLFASVTDADADDTPLVDDGDPADESDDEPDSEISIDGVTVATVRHVNL